MVKVSNFGFGTTVEDDFDAAVERVTEELAKEGFGVLTVIDVQATLKKKLDVDMPAYRILGACNPVLANQAINAVPDIGLLLPCNVLVREDNEGKVHVEFMDPGAVLGLVEDARVDPLAAEVKQKLETVLEAL
ncbi:MAG: DUF302 domain-containing protein [Gammaproteobacteria bacterium]|nr:DUF302 domain-containing protein [Gammaproteobacteria bacterium]NNK99933.1 DUF302 domain-containing protein [Xanthomonadales bacterium]